MASVYVLFFGGEGGGGLGVFFFVLDYFFSLPMTMFISFSLN